ncbi:Mth938-like domain-containing protein [Steroidobacter sp. S1-65]|uniref:Mth938-like domain-containing protein n=1 Tax=Steroidobacter gossypii TaxID=2805490 RepID=A0ABS1WVV9_9GAMM|nr:Mth938-like domain-containing protein [Steroidobacter gossypii]MBM0105105.1 Mth938-like domain-containing protein [Steroidobacter gossypii]
MKLTDEKIGGINMIRSYAPGEIRIGETVIRGSCLVTADQIVSDWRPQTAAELTLEDLQQVIAMQPEVVVIGSGPRQQFPAPEVLGAVLSRGIGCEVMDTGAACRTYNILASEGRTVVAALLVGESHSHGL